MFNIFFAILSFLLGLIVGSFLNCIIYRLKDNKNLASREPCPPSESKSFLKGRSFCPKCKHSLSWYELIPIFSFIIQGGKCRHCGKKISLQYPLVELATGVLFVFIFLNLGEILKSELTDFYFLNLIYYWTISALLIVIFVFDLKHYIIPDKIVYPAIIIAFLFSLFFGLSQENFNILLEGFLSGFFSALFFMVLFLFSKGKWLGLGDVKLIFFMGLFLGFPSVLVALFSAHLFGAIIGLVLVFLRKKGLKSEIPFGPFLIAGTYVALFYGENLINWYLSLFYAV